MRASTKMGTFSRFWWVLFLIVSVQSRLGSHPSSKECKTAFDLEHLGIADPKLSALSYYKRFPNGDGKEFEANPRCARLNNHDCAWCAASENGQYLQVDLGSDVVITGIATQGFETLSDLYFVKEYKVAYRRDGKTWKFLPQVMIGNRDGRSRVRRTFSSPIYARYIRVYPMAYSNKICMRMELYGCSNLSSILSTKTSPRTQSAANNTTPENVPPTTRTTAASSTDKPIIMIHSTAASSVLSTIPSPTTLSDANNTTPENAPPTTRTRAASSTEKPIDHPVVRGKELRTTAIIALVAAVVITLLRVVCLLVCTICRRKGTRSNREVHLL